MTRQKILTPGRVPAWVPGWRALCARRTDRLDELKTELSQRYPDVNVAVAALDVNDHDQVPKVFGARRQGYPWSEGSVCGRKAGVRSLGESLRAEYASGPITVSVMEPGYIESGMTAQVAERNVDGGQRDWREVVDGCHRA